MPKNAPPNFLRTGQKKRTGCFKQRDDHVIVRSQSGKSEELKSCIEDLNKDLNRSFGPTQQTNDDNENSQDKFFSNDLSFEADDNKENRKKTPVGRFLNKQNLRFEESQSVDSEDLSKGLPILGDLPMQKAQSEIKNVSPDDPNFHYFSDPPKSDVESEQSFDSSKDSKPTEGSTGSLAMYVPYRMFESSGGSDSVLPNEMSNSDKSVRSSPLNNRLGTSGYKKSKFYNENVFTFENSKTSESKGYADEENENKDNNREEDKHDEKDFSTKMAAHRSLGVIHPEKFSSGHLVKTSDNEHPRQLFKQHTMMIPGDTAREGSLAKRPVNTKQTEDLIKLRHQMNKKKDMIKIYEIVTTKGKIIMNKEPYQWSINIICLSLIIFFFVEMEKLREEIRVEIENLLKKIDDGEIKNFTDNVLKLIDVNISSYKNFILLLEKNPKWQTLPRDKETS